MVFLDAFRDLNQSEGYSWGTTTPIHMHENLNVASKHSTKHLVGYITLLQVVILFFLSLLFVLSFICTID